MSREYSPSGFDRKNRDLSRWMHCTSTILEKYPPFQSLYELQTFSTVEDKVLSQAHSKKADIMNNIKVLVGEVFLLNTGGCHDDLFLCHLIFQSLL
jgi:hypothetical protein